MNECWIHSLTHRDSPPSVCYYSHSFWAKSFTFKSSLILWVLVFFIHNFLHILPYFLRFPLCTVGQFRGGTQDVMPDFLMTLVQLHMRLVAVPPLFFVSLYNFSSCCIFVSCFLFCFVLLLQLPWLGIFVKLYTLC